jgi:potassium-dependent mechanosensitive channel
MLSTSRWLLFLLLCLAGTPGAAQPVQENTGEERAEPTAIAVERIPARLEQARELARRALEATRPVPEAEAVREQLGALAEQVEVLQARTRPELLEHATLRSLDAAREQLGGLRRTISAQQGALDRRAGELSDWRDTLSEAVRTWTLTEAEARRQAAPGEVIEGIRGTLGSLREAARAVGERQGEVLALQGSLAGWMALLDERRLLIDSQLAQAQLALFRPEHPPIWRGEPTEGALAASRESWLSDWQIVRDYLEARRGGMPMYVGLLILLVGAFAMLSRKVGRWVTDKPELAAPLAIFRHPLAAALILAILAGPTLFPDAPLVLRELFGVLLILPLLLVLPLIITPSLRNALYLLAGLYLLMRLNSLLGAGTALERYALLLLALAAIAAGTWIFRPGGPAARLEAGRWWRAVHLGTRLALLLLGLALLANISGLVSLSRLLTNAVISSAFAGMVLFAGINVARATIIALFQTRVLQRLNLVRWHGTAVDQWLMRILPLLALAAWLVTTARLFRIDGVFAGLLSTILFSSATIGTIEVSLGDILGFALAIWIGVLVSRFLRFVLSVDVYPRVTLPRGVAATISMLLNYLVLGIAFVLAVAAAGIQLDRFALIVGALSVGIGFGLQNIVNNFVSGLILAFERPVQAGDAVQFGSMFGKVTRIGVRSSTVRTFDGAEVIVPNANLISNEVTNWTLSDYRRRIEVLVGVAYGSNPRQVIELLLNTAKADERILGEPGPTALFLGFGDSSLDFSLRAWTDEFDSFLGIKSDLTLAIHDALYANNIEIPFPQRDLHLRSVDPQAVARLGPVTTPPVGEGSVADLPSLSGALPPNQQRP